MLADVQAKCARMGLSMAEVIRYKLNEALDENDEVLRKKVIDYHRNQRNEEDQT
jgi:hypothetical protein